MQPTQLEYFVAVARERHFGQAAAACFVSPSALSEAIRKLETELGVPLIQRGRAFQGLTQEGELVLPWAQRIIADHRSLAADLSAARSALAARARFGVIPSGVAVAASIVSAFGAANPLTRITMRTSLPSEDIVAGLRSFEFDAGIIHPSAADGPDIVTIPLCRDRATVVVGSGVDLDPSLAESGTITGSRLAELPLCLLEPHMRARQTLDHTMQVAGTVLQPRFECDSVESLITMVRSGPWAAVIPESAAAQLRGEDRLTLLTLVDPEVFTPVVLARLSTEPLSALFAEIDAAATSHGKEQDRRREH